MAMHTSSRTGALLDRTALRFNQGAIIVLIGLGFVLAQPWLVGLVAFALALGTIIPALAPFQRLYRDILRPARLLRPDPSAEDAAPHRFAQGLGASVLLIAMIAFLADNSILGWGLALLVVVLAAANLLFGFCAGCFLYFQLHRIGVLQGK